MMLNALRPIGELAPILLSRRHRQAKKHGKSFARQAEEERHRLRLAFAKSCATRRSFWAIFTNLRRSSSSFVTSSSWTTFGEGDSNPACGLPATFWPISMLPPTEIDDAGRRIIVWHKRRLAGNKSMLRIACDDFLENAALLNSWRIDELHLDYPFAGSRMLRDLLRGESVAIGRQRVATMIEARGDRGALAGPGGRPAQGRAGRRRQRRHRAPGAPGTGARQLLGLLGIAVEAEREVVNIVVPTDYQELVSNAIFHAGGLGKPGGGYLYLTALEKVATLVPEHPSPPARRRWSSRWQMNSSRNRRVRAGAAHPGHPTRRRQRPPPARRPVARQRRNAGGHGAGARRRGVAGGAHPSAAACASRSWPDW